MKLAQSSCFPLSYLVKVSDGQEAQKIIMPAPLQLSTILDTSVVMQQPTRRRAYSPESLLLAVGFLSTLLTFLVLDVSQCFRKDNLLAAEKRRASRFPSLALDKLRNFAPQFEEYLNDRLVFKNQMVGSMNMIKLKLFALSGSKQVLRGRLGVFFFNSVLDMALIHGDKPFSKEELVSWQRVLEQRTAFCRAHGMDYVFIIAPSKESIYPELLPFLPSPNRSRADELIDYLKASKSHVQVVDLRPALRRHKQPHFLFYKTDMHWNALGALVGYTELISFLNQRHYRVGPPLRLDQCRMILVPWSGGLARMLALMGTLNELIPVFLEPPKLALTTSNYGEKYRNCMGIDMVPPFYTTSLNRNLPRGIIFHDSFGVEWNGYLPKHFSTLGSFWQQNFSTEVLLKERPNIVLQEMLETFLYEPAPPWSI